MAASQDGERMPDEASPHAGNGQLPDDWEAWYTVGSERVGRHGATAPDLNETLILPPMSGAAITDETTTARVGPRRTARPGRR